MLPVRAAGAEPVVTAVDMRAELAAGNRGLLSDALAAALAALDTGARATGRSSSSTGAGPRRSSLCRDCGTVQACPDCDRPLVYHQAGTTLRCHHCGRAWPIATRCPACASPRIRYLGGGTERVEREVRERFPGLRVGRLDRDVVERKGAADRVLDDFAAGRLDVLVGTSLVAKGLDVAEVTLVGVVSADIALNLPDERASERTYQLLAQAVGRAGPRRPAGTRLHPDLPPGAPRDPCRRRAATPPPSTTRSSRSASGSGRRRSGGSSSSRSACPSATPPSGRRARWPSGCGRAAVERGSRVQVAGPAPAYVARRGDRWRYNVVLRGADPVALLDPAPGAPWSVDVDPESLL